MRWWARNALRCRDEPSNNFCLKQDKEGTNNDVVGLVVENVSGLRVDRSELEGVGCERVQQLGRGCCGQVACRFDVRQNRRNLQQIHRLMAFKASQFLFHGSGVPPASKCLSHQALQLNCFIQKVDSGLYSLLPLGQLVIDRINRLIEDEFSRIGALKISVPILGPKKLWDETERWDAMGKELFQLSDRGKSHFCLQPTAEEMVTSLVRNLPSLRVASLPLLLYQTTEKFRDERNPRFGLIRGRQFLMNDMYSFDVDVDSCQKTYSLVTSAYRRIFKDALQLEIRTVVSDPGVHGGAISHEYHLENNLEEDKISYCSRCEIGHKPGETDPQCSHSELQEMSSIEIAHTFQLGTRYAQAFKAFVPGTQRPLEMACYGIGVSRLLPACVDALSIDVKAIRLPNKIVPFDAAIITASKLSSDPTALSLCEELQSALQARNMTVLLHDMHKMSVGDRLYDLNRIGIPRIFVLANVTKRSFSTETELSAVGKSGEVRLDMVTITSGTDRDHRDRDRTEKNGTIGSSNAERHKSNGLELRVLTLNMWCLPQPWPVGSKDRKHRLKRLAEALLIEEYDIVGLQEIWKEGDYLDLVDQLKDVYKFHHYFHSGWTGSGVCILSRHPIVSTLTHRFILFFSSSVPNVQIKMYVFRYSLNGFAHHVHRGDWFGGKV
ncbi:hypothetical protein WR25_16859 isoform F [Diploscapter pachys]|uniref:proline--tRNA ligase n=1 Tax=Diploscapter pachys TaxID=2018661 RepID=A0A2A2LDL5_9BILA|nr:hypothetical protein WR25_16859 isoform A [Diploscapter pachys]PAV84271.1 hypothetical protein WR25_16859 isoform B [Diploscapter pachys]PAV84272.1 hypothetical protein WR25_16859 isoform C [Diploscapter pachys]PAV84273.1 hypothetical protein WR25_16859 isoform D [Diploscapter pachys]PAV84274.1 hypothetical protein WR25_16859 isoform E [Diploscapter pachys]